MEWQNTSNSHFHSINQSVPALPCRGSYPRARDGGDGEGLCGKLILYSIQLVSQSDTIDYYQRQGCECYF